MAAPDMSTLTVAQAFKEYKWFNSCNVQQEVQLAVVRFELPIDLHANGDEVPADLYVTAHIVSNQTSMNECPISTHFGTVDDTRNCILWDDVLMFPLKYRDLSIDAILVLTVYAGDGTVFGGTSMRFFDENGCVRRGKQKNLVYLSRPGDPNVITSHNGTPGHLHDLYAPWDHSFMVEKTLENYRQLLASQDAPVRRKLVSHRQLTAPSVYETRRSGWID
jgi:hypothetical protein